MIQHIKETENPIVKANILSFYISDGLRGQKLNLYEAYLLQWEVLNNTREWYTLPAWNGKVQISTCLALLNQKLLAEAFCDDSCVRLLHQWGVEAFRLCSEKILLEKTDLSREKTVSEEIETILIELNT